MFNKRYYTAGLYEGALLRFLNSLDPEDSCSCVRIYDCFTFAGHACLVMEKLQGTLVDLMMEIAEVSARKRAAIVRKVAMQILSLLSLLHSKDLVHSDLKPENVLIQTFSETKDHQGNECLLKVKVIDFANCFAAKEEGSGDCDVIQTLTYRAPEIFLGNQPQCSVDMWSLGCILVEMALLSPLFTGQSEEAVFKEIEALMRTHPHSSHYHSQGKRGGRMSDHHISKRSPEFFKLYEKLARVDVQLADFVNKLLAMDPARRLAAKAGFEHSFLQHLFPFRQIFGSGLPGGERSGAPEEHLESAAFPTLRSAKPCGQRQDTIPSSSVHWSSREELVPPLKVTERDTGRPEAKVRARVVGGKAGDSRAMGTGGSGMSPGKRASGGKVKSNPRTAGAAMGVFDLLRGESHSKPRLDAAHLPKGSQVMGDADDDDDEETSLEECLFVNTNKAKQGGRGPVLESPPPPKRGKVAGCTALTAAAAAVLANGRVKEGRAGGKKKKKGKESAEAGASQARARGRREKTKSTKEWWKA